MKKTLMTQNRIYRLEKIRQIEIANSKWLTFVQEIKSISIIKVGLALLAVTAFIIFLYWFNETLAIRDLQLFV